MTVPEVLREAERLIAGHWSRTGFQPGRYCPIEAIGEAAMPNVHLTEAAWDFFEDSIGERFISRWNEEPVRTEAEVRAALLAAADRAEAAS